MYLRLGLVRLVTNAIIEAIGRKTQGLFWCQHCEREDNADRNAAFCIANRGLGQCSSLGVKVTIPKTTARIDRNPMMIEEATGLIQW
jgi:transposase